MTTRLAQLDVDLGEKAGEIRPLHGVNLGPIQNNGSMDLSECFKELAFPSVRLHDCPYVVADTVDVHCIFPIFDADADDPGNYRFAPTDDYIQAILDTGSQIAYRLGESIEHHTRRKYFVHPPRDFQKWAAICVNIIRHYNDGWANGFRHNIRYWEIWNEAWLHPKCWTGTHEQYYHLYEIAAKTIKAHDANLMVGGPAAAGGKPSPFAEGFLEHCRRTDAPLDFYSWHRYTPEPLDITEDAVACKEMLARYGFDKTESHLNEWNYLPAEGWTFHGEGKAPDMMRRAFAEIGGAYGAAFTAAMLIYMQDCPIDMANFYWARVGRWGFLDQYGAPRKNFWAFKAFRSLLDHARRVRTTPNDPHTGYALLAGLAETPEAAMLLVNCRAREHTFVITVRNWPWKGNAVCKRYVLDHSRNLVLTGQDTLEENNATVRVPMIAPSFCYMTLTPDGKD